MAAAAANCPLGMACSPPHIFGNGAEENDPHNDPEVVYLDPRAEKWAASHL
jgi:hypothetical protein